MSSQEVPGCFYYLASEPVSEQRWSTLADKAKQLSPHELFIAQGDHIFSLHDDDTDEWVSMGFWFNGATENRWAAYVAAQLGIIIRNVVCVSLWYVSQPIKSYRRFFEFNGVVHEIFPYPALFLWPGHHEGLGQDVSIDVSKGEFLSDGGLPVKTWKTRLYTAEEISEVIRVESQRSVKSPSSSERAPGN